MESETVEGVLALIEQRPADAALHQRLGRLLNAAGRWDEAREAFERSLELDPTDAFTHLYLGNWYYREGDYPAALARFSRAVELLPGEGVAHWCQADAYLELGQYAAAQRAYETAVRVDPANEEARGRLAEWHQRRGGTAKKTRRMIRQAYDNDQAATVVLLAARYLRTHPNDLDVIDRYADMLYQMTRYDEAVAVYLDAVERFQAKRWALFNKLGNLHRYRGDFATAERWFEKGVEENPGEASSYILLGAVQARQGKLTEAEETHRRATGCARGHIDEAHHNLGLVLRGQGRLTEAADSFRRAIALCPDYTEALEALQDVESALALSAEGDATSPA